MVGHVNSGVAIATGQVYADCGLAVITPMASNPKVTESGFTTLFRLTNRDDRKGSGPRALSDAEDGQDPRARGR